MFLAKSANLRQRIELFFLLFELGSINQRVGRKGIYETKYLVIES